MNNDFEKEFNMGGNVQRALSGDYPLSVASVLNEAGKCTIKTFLSFSPAMIILLAVQLGIFYLALQLQIGDPSQILDAFNNPESFTEHFVQAIFIANFSYEVISAPIFAGASLMAMSHVVGMNTKLRHIGKGLQFTVPVILATLMSLVIQGVAGMLLPFLSMYFALAFTHSILLICEKRLSPLNSLYLSLRAVNKKIFVIFGIYSIVTIMFVMAVMFYGIGLIFVMPFFFHVKGILYREMFGIKLKVVATDGSHHDDDDSSNDDDNNSDDDDNSKDDEKSNRNPQVFDA